MKLPEFQTGPVQKFGGIDEARDALTHLGRERAQAWAGVSQIGVAASNFGMEMARGTSQVQHAEALAELADADAKAKKDAAARVLMSRDELAAKFGGVDKIPQSIKDRVGSLDKLEADPDNPDSEGLVVGRTDIPAWAVNPDIYKLEMDKAVAKAAERITLPGFKDHFTREASKAVANEYAQHQLEAQKEFYDWKNAKMGLTAIKLAESGQIGPAKNVTALMDVKESKRVELNADLERRSALYQINKPLLAEDVAGLEHIVEGLKEGRTQFGYTNGKGELEKVDVSALPEQTRRELAFQMDRKLRSIHTIDREEVDRQKKDYNDKLTYGFIQMYQRGDLAGIRSFLMNPPAGISGAKYLQLSNLADQWMGRASKPPPMQKEYADLTVETLEAAAEQEANQEDLTITDPLDSSENKEPVKFSEMDLDKIARERHLTSTQYSKLLKLQRDLRAGVPFHAKAPDVRQGEAIVTQLLTDPGTSNRDQMALNAAKRAAFTRDLRAYETLHKLKLDLNGVKEFAQSWAANQNTYNPGNWLVGPSTTLHYSLSDVPPEYIAPLQQVRAMYKGKFGLSARDLDQLYDANLKKYIDPLQKAWLKTTSGDQQMKPSDLLQAAAFLDIKHDELVKELQIKYGVKNPDEQELAYYYFQRSNRLKEAVFGKR